MRTAEEIIKDSYGWSDIEIKYHSQIAKSVTIKAINEARKEAIEECAERVILHYKGNGHPVITVDKQSILSLINELK